MTVNVPSFFAGIGTVLVLLVLGFGGGVMMSGVIADKPRGPGKVEKWAAEQKQPIEATKPAVMTATPTPVSPPPAPAPEPVASTAAQPVASTEPAPAAPPAQVSTVSAQPAAPPPPAATPVPQAAPTLQERPVALTTPAQQAPAQESAREKRKAKREAAEKRKAQLRKQTAERRRPQSETAEQVREIERRPLQQDVGDDDDRAPFPFFGRRERSYGDVRSRPFRLFSDDDD